MAKLGLDQISYRDHSWLHAGWWMCKVDEKVGWAPPSYLKKCITKDADSDSEEEYLGLPESCKQ